MRLESWIVMLVALASGPFRSEIQAQVTWSRAPIIGGKPYPRMAYDSARQRVVLVSTSYSSYVPVRHEVWEWDGSVWTQQSFASGPSPRGFDIAYHASRNRVVMFSGSELARGETWEWDGSNWTQRFPATSPTGRCSTVMAYDGARQRVVLFGGYVTNGAGCSGLVTYLNDTWEWDGTNWTQQLPLIRPPARSEHALAYDAARQRIVLFGGDSNIATFADTWEWDGTTWVQRLPATSPPPRWGPALAYDTGRQRLVLFGGSRFGAYGLADTWEWDGSSWMQRLAARSPPGRDSHAMVFDAARAQVLMFGGTVGGYPTPADASTWSWDGTNWHDDPVSPTQRDAPAMAYDLARDRVVLFGGIGGFRVSGSAYQDETWEWDGQRWHLARPSLRPPARTNAGMAYDSARRRTVLFGGRGAPGEFGDTWEWDGTTWVQRTPPASPPARSGHMMAYDSVRQRTVLFGGTGGSGDDTWEWDGTVWMLRLPLTNPPPRSGGTLVFQEARGRALLFGGAWPYVMNDTWEWDGTIWTQRQTPGPQARTLFAASYDRARSRVVVHGGSWGYAAGLNDTWECSGNGWIQRNPATPLPAMWNHAMAYHGGTGRMVALASESAVWSLGTAVEGTWEYYPTQPATSSAFGSGCGGSAGVPVLTSTSRPWIGEPWAVNLTGLPAGQPAVLLLGGSATTWGPVSLPLGLGLLGAPACALLVSPDVAIALGVTAGSATWAVPLTGAVFAGASFHQQGLVFDPSAGLGSLVMSNGLTAIVGAK